MHDVMIKFTNENNVQNFVKLICALKGEFELINGNFILDARSLMGIYSLDLTQPIKLRIYDYSEDIDKTLVNYIIS